MILSEAINYLVIVKIMLMKIKTVTAKNVMKNVKLVFKIMLAKAVLPVEKIILLVAHVSMVLLNLTKMDNATNVTQNVKLVIIMKLV